MFQVLTETVRIYGFDVSAIASAGVSVFPDDASTSAELLQQTDLAMLDDYLVWHNVPIGPKARQPDFVVLHPRCGVLLLEVKDWKAGTLMAANRDSVDLDTERGHVTDANPLRQARDYTLELVTLMQRDESLTHVAGEFKGKLLFPYGWGAVFSKLKREDVENSAFLDVFPAHQILMADELADSVSPEFFLARLWRMFTVHYPCTLTLPQRDRVRWHLFPEVRLQTQSALNLEPESEPLQLPNLLQVMDLQQEQIARSLGERHRVIHGAAGSGKTMILIFRAVQLAAATRVDRPILVLCYNRALADRIDTMLRKRGIDERVQVRTFHQWCQDIIRTYQLDVPKGLTVSEYFMRLTEVVSLAVDQGHVPAGQYTALLMDEAHDFDDDWSRIAGRMVGSETNSLLVLYDDVQSIYQKKRRTFNFSSVGINAVGRTNIRKLNYRNTAEVLTLALHCAQGLLDGENRSENELQLIHPASAGRRGELPILIEGRNEFDEAELIAERIVSAINDGTAIDDIAVLARAK